MIKYGFLFVILVVSLLGLSTVQADQSLLKRQEVQDFINELVKKDGFSRAELENIFNQVRPMPEVVHRMNHPAEAMMWNQYESLFVTSKRVQQGIEFSQKNAAVLSKAEKQYGVPAAIIVSILGVESNYGTVVMKYRAIDALANLAFNFPSRQAFFQSELKSFLELTRKYHLETFGILSSYAGAIGPAQFMPDSVLKDAVVTPGDENLNSASDWIESIGNYLSNRGWVKNGPIVSAISCPTTMPTNIVVNSRKNFYTPEQLRDAGISDSAKEEAMIIQLQTDSGYQCWLGYHNFSVILRYNGSPLYAMAVYELSEKI